MTQTATEQRLASLICEILRIPPYEISDALDMEATSTWDSLSHMQLIGAIEDEFELELSADEIIGMRSVGDIKSTLRSKGLAL